MNKKILAVAVSMAMFAGASAAMAGEAEVYGKVHVSLDSMDNGAKDDATGYTLQDLIDGNTTGTGTTAQSGTYLSSNSSRLGIKGSEDLGNGMKAIFQYEWGFDVATKKALSADRNSYVGLKGGFGTVLAGRHDMPFKTAVRKFDLFGDTIGDTRALFRAKELGDDYAMRRNNVVMYKGKGGPVAFDVAYGFENGDEGNTDMGARVTFKQGPMTVMGAYETHGLGKDSSGDAIDDSSAWILAGSYGIGTTTLAAGYTSLSTIGGNKDLDATGYTLAVAHGMGSNTFKLQYSAVDPDAKDVKKLGATLLAVGVDHKLSKMTKVYAVYASIANDKNGFWGFNDTGHAKTADQTKAALGDDPSGFSVGIIHKF
jgi:predicted porin